VRLLKSERESLVVCWVFAGASHGISVILRLDWHVGGGTLMFFKTEWSEIFSNLLMTTSSLIPELGSIRDVLPLRTTERLCSLPKKSVGIIVLMTAQTNAVTSLSAN